MHQQQQLLHASRIVTVEGCKGLRIRLLQGQLWVTQTNDPHDHFLQAEQMLPLTSGRVVIEAEQDSQYVLEDLPGTRHLLRHVWRAWRRWCSSAWAHCTHSLDQHTALPERP